MSNKKQHRQREEINYLALGLHCADQDMILDGTAANNPITKCFFYSTP